MADGSARFNFPLPQHSQLRPGEIVVDLFAGGGGASEALKQALGVDPALAYNHDEWAIGMHAANHPLTAHHREDIWHADPRTDVAGRKVGWFHASPDCTHFSQAKGGQPRNRKIRALSWVIPKWIGQLAKVGRAPRIVSMENVWQIRTWGPLVAKRDKATGRVLKLDGTVAAKGERVPVDQQQLVPDKRHVGRTWKRFVAVLESFGYTGEARKLVASDYGAGTSRERLFGLWRRDGEPVVWPKPTHGTAPGLLPLITAADCIDFTDLGRSIFDRPRPLADATMHRIAKGVVKHVLQAESPFIVEASHEAARDTADAPQPLAGSGLARRDAARDEAVRGHALGGRSGQGPFPQPRTVRPGDGTSVASHDLSCAPFLTEFANASNGRTWPAGEPLRTQCAGVKGGHFAVVAPTLVKFRGQSPGTPLSAPVPTITSGAGAKRPAGAAHALGLMTAFLEQACSGYYTGAGHDLRRPAPTICAKGSIQRLITADMAELSPEAEAGALRVAAFLISYYGNGNALNLRDPLDTVTTRDRMALVTVHLQGVPYVIVDIALRMLKPAELFRAQGFPPDYIIDRTADGRRITTTAAVRMVGNSVSPPPLRALALANLDRADAPIREAA